MKDSTERTSWSERRPCPRLERRATDAAPQRRPACLDKIQALDGAQLCPIRHVRRCCTAQFDEGTRTLAKTTRLSLRSDYHDNMASCSNSRCRQHHHQVERIMPRCSSPHPTTRPSGQRRLPETVRCTFVLCCHSSRLKRKTSAATARSSGVFHSLSVAGP